MKRFHLVDPDGLRLDFFQGRAIFEALAAKARVGCQRLSQ